VGKPLPPFVPRLTFPPTPKVRAVGRTLLRLPRPGTGTPKVFLFLRYMLSVHDLQGSVPTAGFVTRMRVAVEVDWPLNICFSPTQGGSIYPPHPSRCCSFITFAQKFRSFRRRHSPTLTASVKTCRAPLYVMSNFSESVFPRSRMMFLAPPSAARTALPALGALALNASPWGFPF